MKRLFAAVVVVAIGGFAGHPSVASAQSLFEEIGFSALKDEKGASLETGAGLRVLQVEAQDGNGAYMPQPEGAGGGEFAGKTFINGTLGTPNTGVNGHAAGVGISFYGNSQSIAPGISNVTGLSATEYLNVWTGLANLSLTSVTLSDPLAQGFNISNHSYIGNIDRSNAATLANEIAIKEQVLRRVDFVINRDNTINVVGANNGSATMTPDFLAPSYNSITVGLTNGNHSRGLSPVGEYGGGRFRPDIVVPEIFTSNATPVVGSAAAILQQAAGFDGAGNANNGGQNEVVKAMLFAGATKQEFGAAWDRTTTRPIDEVFGFGELNIQNSYHILEGGEFNATANANPTNNIGLEGWDYGDFSAGQALFYDFEIAPGQRLGELSAVLNWNVAITDGNPSASIFDPLDQLANLDLELFDSSGTFVYGLGNFPGSLIDSSLSTDYNYEHISLTSLEAGNYTFRITGDLATDYGFAWRISTVAVPEPASGLILAIGAIGWSLRRRKSW